MSRKTARKEAFSLVYQTMFHSISDIGLFVEDYFRNVEPEERDEIDDSDMTFITDTVGGAFGSFSAIDGVIRDNLSKWSPEQLSKVDTAILRLGVYEMLYNEDIPCGVAINEAVELAKEFGSDESPAFVNGVLAAVFRGMKP